MELTLLLGVALTCAASGIVPWISAEVAVAGVAVLVRPEQLPWLVFAGAVGQMVGKAAVYAAARWTPGRLPRRARALLERAERVGGARGLAVVAFASAAFGIPPFYLVTLACGTLAVPLVTYVIAGLLGTAIRYSILGWGITVLASATP